MKILFTGGGTGGHIFPIIALAREIRRLIPEEGRVKFFYLGPRETLAKIVLSQEGIEVKHILAGKIRRYFTPLAILQNLIDILFKLPLGFLQTFFYIFWFSPDLVFCKGGYGSFAAGFWGWFFGSPIFVHESDVAPGLSNKLLSKFASRLFVSFPKTEYFPYEKMKVLGNPVRRELLTGSRGEAAAQLRLCGGRPVILVLGGSQGSRRINDLILEILPRLLDDFELIHQTGERNLKQINLQAEALISQSKRASYHAFGFLQEQELRQIYAAADLVISRAGGNTIFEIALLQKPCILIPLPESAQDHQVKNAYAYCSYGAGLVLEETNLTSNFFLEKIKYLFSAPEILGKMREAAEKFARPEAAKVIAQELVGFLDER